MPDPQEVNFGIRELYPNFFNELRILMISQLELNKILTSLLKIIMALIIINIVLIILCCLAALMIPIFSASIISWLSTHMQITPTY